jgi:hypothetical protein
MWKWVAPGQLGLSLAKRPLAMPPPSGGVHLFTNGAVVFRPRLEPAERGLPDHQIFIRTARRCSPDRRIRGALSETRCSELISETVSAKIKSMAVPYWHGSAWTAVIPLT